MATAIDIEIIINCLFKSLYKCISNAENDVFSIIEKENKESNNNFRMIEDNIVNIINKSVDGFFDKIDIVLNKLDNINKHKKNKTYVNIKNRKGRNTELTDKKNNCNYDRSQGRGKCTIMIKKEEHACYVHKNRYFKENSNSFESISINTDPNNENLEDESDKKYSKKYKIKK